MIDLKVITKERIIYEDNISEITISTEDGVITVLPNHAPLVSILKIGEMLIKKDSEQNPFAISGGILEVRKKSRVFVLAETTENIDDIDIKRAEEAYKRAEELLKTKGETDRDYIRLKGLSERNLNRIHLVKRRHAKY